MSDYPAHLPHPFFRRVLKTDAPGGSPESISAVVPSITTPGEDFSLTIAVLDEMGYPSVECEGALQITLPEQPSKEVDLHFEPGVPAVGTITELSLPTEGIHRISLSVGDLSAETNPTLCTRDNVPPIYWGDPHVHTNLSDCHPDKCRSLNFGFACARFVTGLDWAAAADHVSNDRCDFSKWTEQKSVANHHNAEPNFVTLPAYEASLPGGCGGDNNVYMDHFPEMYVDHWDDGTIKTLCEELEGKMNEGEFFVVPHHTTRARKHGEISDDIYPGPDRMPLLEIHSKWGTSEHRGNENALHETHEGPSYAVDFLDRGMPLGFIAGTDTHASMPSGGGYEPGHIDRLPGLTAVRSSRLTRQSIFEALRERHCYATSKERIILHGTIAGAVFGETVEGDNLSDPLEVDVQIAAESAISRIDLVRNGENICSVQPNDWKTRFTWTDTDRSQRSNSDSAGGERPTYYYLRVTCTSGARAWSSPVWISPA